MDEDTVEPQAEPIEQIMDEADVSSNTQEGTEQVEKPEKTMIPLSVAQKLREKKKELELELQWERQERQRLMNQQKPQPEPEDDSRYESATKEDLNVSQQEAIRVIEEKLWIRQNPEKYEKVNEQLPIFLKQRPNLASAIAQSANRYEEAYTLMEALTPKQQQQLRKEAVATPKKEAPNAPGSVPKAAVLNETVDVMNMSDKEFAEWRATKRKRR